MVGTLTYTKRTDIDVTLLRKTFSYDHNTGHFYRTPWALARSGRIGCPTLVLSSSAVGGPHASGYWRIGFNGRRWLAQNLVWAYVHGEIPAGDIDHINRNKSDNRIANLRLVSRAQNMRNCERNDRRGNALGTVKVHSGWAAQVSDNGRTISLGTFKSQAEAHACHIKYVNTHGLVAP